MEYTASGGVAYGGEADESFASPPALLGEVFCTHGRNLIGGAVFCTVRCHLGIDTTLEAAPNGNHIPGVTLSDVLGSSSPNNAGQIVCPVECSWDSQHGVADLPTQGCSTESGFPAQRAFQIYIIQRFAAFNNYRGSKYEDK